MAHPSSGAPRMDPSAPSASAVGEANSARPKPYKDPTDRLRLTEQHFDAIREMLLAHAGIVLTPAKRAMVHSRLGARLRALKLADFESYVAFLKSEAGANELPQLINRLTTNVTAFFREPHHLEDLAELARHTLESGRRRIRIWSAGCSTGQEPYSIAATLAGVIPDDEAVDVRVLATDLDSEVLAQAAQGLYPLEALEAVPREYREYFPVHREGFSPSQKLRRMVIFRQLNLIGQWPLRGPMDAIFCRNVTIYFHKTTQTEVHRRAVSLLRPGGRLYLGHAETAETAPLGLQRVGRTTYETKAGGALGREERR